MVEYIKKRQPSGQFGVLPQIQNNGSSYFVKPLVQPPQQAFLTEAPMYYHYFIIKYRSEYGNTSRLSSRQNSFFKPEQPPVQQDETPVSPCKQQLRDIEDQYEQNLKELKEQKRDLVMIESDLGRIHRKFLIENQTTYSILLDQIMEFEKDFRRQQNEEKQQKAFIQVQINNLHKEKRIIEAHVRNIDRRAQWCQDEIGNDDD